MRWNYWCRKGGCDWCTCNSRNPLRMALVSKPETEHEVLCRAKIRRPIPWNINTEEILNSMLLSLDARVSYACSHVEKQGVGNRLLEDSHPLPGPIIKAQRRKHEKVAVWGHFRLGFEQTEYPSHSQTNQNHYILQQRSLNIWWHTLTVFSFFVSGTPLELSSWSFSFSSTANSGLRLRNKLMDTDQTTNIG